MIRRHSPWPFKDIVFAKYAGSMPRQMGMLLFAFWLSACQTTSPPPISGQNSAVGSSDLSTPQLEQLIDAPPLGNDSLTGTFLVGHVALADRKLDIAADYFTRALSREPANPDLLQRSFLALYQTGQIDEAAIIGRQIEAVNLSLPLSSEPAAIIAILDEDWDAVEVLAGHMLEAGGISNMGQLAAIWAKLAKGQDSAALADMISFARSLSDETIPVYMYLHLAHLYELVDQPEAAKTYLAQVANSQAESAQVNLSVAAAYWRLGEPALAEAIIADKLDGNVYIPQLLADLRSDRSDLARPLSLNRAIAQSILDDSWLNINQTSAGLLMPHAHMALRLDPELHAARFVLAQLFAAMSEPERAMTLLAEIPATSAWAQPALFLHISLLQEKRAFEEARSRLQTAISQWPENRRLHHLMGDVQRRNKNCEAALSAYAQAASLGDNSATLLRSQGVCFFEVGDGLAAESYLQQAINMNPSDAYALNYLGYIWADEGRNLDAALSYIREAVTLRPDSGYFADSLGWVYYRMGELDNAVLWLEKAFQLTPDDLVITEHLADAYWRAGRYYEARYKWIYALDLSETDADKQRLHDKLSLPKSAPLPGEPE